MSISYFPFKSFPRWTCWIVPDWKDNGAITVCQSRERARVRELTNGKKAASKNSNPNITTAERFGVGDLKATQAILSL
jgi:hypothetical protein